MITEGTPTITRDIDIFNFNPAGTLTAALDLETLTAEPGGSALFAADFAPSLGIPAGGSAAFSVAFSATQLGEFSQIYTLQSSDEDLPGGVGGAPLTLTVLAEVVPFVQAADYNSDGFVSQADLDLVLLNWGDTVLPPGFDEAALTTGTPFDGQMSQNELDGVLLNWGNGTPPSVSIPEPSALAVSTALLCGLTRRRSPRH